jgi:rfaE bifunctional protein kinase chain/domain
MSKINWEEIVSEFDKLNILVIGDAMIDSYIWGDIERNSPEAPIPIVNATKYEKKLGGAANVALNIKSLGANPTLISVIGNNDNGFLDLMKKFDLSVEGILQEDRLTTTKTRVISNNKHQLRIDEENTNDIVSENELINQVFNSLAKTDVVLFQDYNKGVLTKRVIREVIDKCNELNIPTLADPKLKNYWEYKNVSLFKPNLKELNDSSESEILSSDLKSISLEVKKQRLKLNAKEIIVTLSDNGVFFQNDNLEFHLPIYIKDIVDVSGAGDCVIAILALIYNSNLNKKEIVSLANLCGGLACKKVGVASLEKVELTEQAIRLI